MSGLLVSINGDDHQQGNPDAACVLVEYADYQCPACGQAYPIVKRLQKHFGKRLSFVFRNFPLSQVHPQAESAAETAEFAASQGRFWEMHDVLYENQEYLAEGLYVKLAEKLHLATDKLRDALKAKTFQPRVQRDHSSGVRSGVTGTPTFFINGQKHDGSYGFDALVKSIELAISANK